MAFNRYSYLLTAYHYAAGRIIPPTLSGFCTIAFAAVANAMLSSRVFPAPCNAEAERLRASPMPVDEIAKRFELGITNYYHIK